RVAPFRSMPLSELQHVEISDFGGPWLRVEPGDVPPTQSLLALNSEWNPGQVSKRKGFGPIPTISEPITSLFNWISSAGNTLFYYNPSSGKVRGVPNLNLTSNAPQDLYTQAGGAGAVIASNGSRVFSAIFDSNGLGLAQCRVIGQQFSVFAVDKAF